MENSGNSKTGRPLPRKPQSDCADSSIYPTGRINSNTSGGKKGASSSVVPTNSLPSRSAERQVTVPLVRESKGIRRLAAITAYDYTFARLVDEAGIDIVLVGDSLGCTIQGHPNTLAVTLEESIYHTRCVVRGVKRALVVGDLPFMSYQVSIEKGIEAAGRMLKEGGATAVKLEGGIAVAPLVRRLCEFDIPVMGHVGLTPQSVHRMGGFKVQGRKKTSADVAGSRKKVLEDAEALEAAGVFAIVLEGLPAEFAAEITQTLSVPTIGIGAGASCDGQILVAHDMLGFTSQTPKFVKRYAEIGATIVDAVSKYVGEVRGAQFPSDEFAYTDEQPKIEMVRARR